MSKAKPKDTPPVDPPPIEPNPPADGVSQPIGTASIDQIAAAQADAAPDANQAVVERAADRAQQIAVERDASNTPFDPSRHEKGPDGKPVKTRAGNFKLKRGRGASSIGSVSKSSGSAKVAEAPQVEPGTPSPSMVASAGAATQMTVMLGMMIGGEEFTPGKSKMLNGADEGEFLNSAYLSYFQAKGISDLPPGVALGFALLIYVAPRFTMPKTRERSIKFVEWIALKWRAFRRRRAAAKAEGENDAAYADPGNDGKRKDNVRETAS